MFTSRNIAQMAFVMLLCLLALSMGSIISSADSVEYNYDRTINVQFPGPGLDALLQVESGDNVTITFSNFQGFTNKKLNGVFTYTGYYQKDSRLDSSLNFGEWITANTPLTIWVIFPKTMEFRFYAMYSDQSTSGSFDVLITRTPSRYASSYVLYEELRTVAQEVRDNITALTGTAQGLVDQMTDLADDVSRLNDTVGGFDQRLSDVEGRFVSLEAALDALNASIAQTNALIGQLQADLAVLAATSDATNGTLQGLIAELDGLDLAWVEQNLTDIRSQVAAIDAALEGMPLLEDDIAALEASVARAAGDISNLTAQLAAVEASVPDAYDDTSLRERLAQLEALNGVLQDRVDDLEKEQQDQRDVKSPDAALVYSAFVIGMLGLVVGVAALLYKKR